MYATCSSSESNINIMLILHLIVLTPSLFNHCQALTQGGSAGYEDPPIAKNIPKRSTLSA